MHRGAYYKLYNEQRKQLRSAQKQLCRLNRRLGTLSDNSSIEATQLTIDIHRQELFVESLKKATKVVVLDDKKKKEAEKEEEEEKKEKKTAYQPSPYEILREENMRKNQQKLKELGFAPPIIKESISEVPVQQKEVVPQEAINVDAERKLWLTVGDALLTEFMVPPLETRQRVPIGSLVGTCFDISPGYFFGVVGPKSKKHRVVGHTVNYTDGDEDWVPVQQLRLQIVNKDKVLGMFPDVLNQIQNKMGKGEVLK